MPSMEFRRPAFDDAGVIWVEDRHGTGLPYSKGLMAASIMATGLGPQRAYELAADIEWALRQSGRATICSESLTATAIEVLSRAEGSGVAERYQAWRRAKRSPRPIVVLVGGATGVGKSTAATRLAARLDLSRVVQTDAIREVMRSFLGPDDAPAIHRSSFEASGDVVAGFLEQSHIVCGAVAGLVRRTAIERRDLIVEGVHLIPGMLAAHDFARLQEKAVIVQVLLTLQSRAVHESHFLNRLENEHGRNPERYLEHLADIRDVDRHLVEMALAHDIAIVEASSLDDTVQQVIDLVVEQVIATEPVVAVT